MKKYIVLGGVTLFAPSIVLAATGGLTSVIGKISDIVALLVPLVISVAVLFFLYGLAKYMLSVGEDKDKGKDIMIYGVIALFVMVSVWGLVNLVGETLGIEGKDANIPNLIIE